MSVQKLQATGTSAGRLEAGDLNMRGHGTEYRSSDEDFEVWLHGDGEELCSGEAGEFGERGSSDVDGDERDEETLLRSGEVRQGCGRSSSAVQRSGGAVLSRLRRASGSARASEGGGTGGPGSMGGAQARLVARPGRWNSATPAQPRDDFGHAQTPCRRRQYRTSTTLGSTG